MTWDPGPNWQPKVGDWVALRCTPAQPLCQVSAVHEQLAGPIVAIVGGLGRHTCWIRLATPEEVAHGQLASGRGASL